MISCDKSPFSHLPTNTNTGTCKLEGMASKELVDVKSVSTKPRAVVILLGWLEANHHYLSKYIDLYHERGCSTVATTASTLSIMFGNEAKISALALTVSLEAARIIRKAELSNPEFGRVPLIVHIFSNGGMFVLEQLEKRLKEVNIFFENQGYFTKKRTIDLGDSFHDNCSRNWNDDSTVSTASSTTCSSPPNSPRTSPRSSSRKRYSPNIQRDLHSPAPRKSLRDLEERRLNQDLLILSKRLKVGCQIFDSAPAYLHNFSDVQAIDSAVSNPLLRIIAIFIFLLYLAWCKILKLFFSGSNRMDKFWKDMKGSDLAAKQVFIYSTSDEITDAEKFNKLVETRKKRGFDVTVVKFSDSSHVQNLRKYKKEYEHVIDQILNAICRKETNESWWSDSEEEN